MDRNQQMKKRYFYLLNNHIVNNWNVYFHNKTNIDKLHKYKIIFLYSVYARLNKLYYASEFLAFKNGPVVKKEYNINNLSEIGLKSIKEINKFQEIEMNIDYKVLDQIMFITQIMTNKELSEFTHQFDAWKLPWNYSQQIKEENGYPDSMLYLFQDINLDDLSENDKNLIEDILDFWDCNLEEKFYIEIPTKGYGNYDENGRIYLVEKDNYDDIINILKTSNYDNLPIDNPVYLTMEDGELIYD